MDRDQAEGLRQLFASELPAPQVCLIACPQREAVALSLARALVERLVSGGRSALWIDDVSLRYREGLPLVAPVRFQWSQWLDGSVALGDAAVAYGERRWYAYSGDPVRSTRTPTVAHPDALRAGGIGADTIVVSSKDGFAFLPILAGRRLHAVMVCEAKPAQLKNTFVWMSRLETQGDLASTSIIPAGDPKACERFHQAIADLGGGFLTSVPLPSGHLSIRLLSTPLTALGREAGPLADQLADRLLTA